MTSPMVESLRWRRLRWRLRGAWQWPTFLALTVFDAVVISRLPFQGEGGDIVGATLAAGFFNLLAVALLAPLGGWVLRRRRADHTARCISQPVRLEQVPGRLKRPAQRHRQPGQIPRRISSSDHGGRR